MSVGMGSSIADSFLGAVFQQTSFSISALWVELHVGDPGVDGSANPAVNTTRVEVTDCFGGAAADDGSGAKRKLANDSIMGPWTDVPAAETYTHVAFYSAETGGTFVGSGTVTAAAVTTGDNFEVPIGDCVIKLPCAA